MYCIIILCYEEAIVISTVEVQILSPILMFSLPFSPAVENCKIEEETGTSIMNFTLVPKMLKQVPNELHVRGLVLMFPSGHYSGSHYVVVK